MNAEEQVYQRSLGCAFATARNQLKTKSEKNPRFSAPVASPPTPGGGVVQVTEACMHVSPSGTVAHKIMQKYGFREGQGLGKHEQGLSTALSVEKTSKRGGKIIVGDAMEKGGSPPRPGFPGMCFSSSEEGRKAGGGWEGGGIVDGWGRVCWGGAMCVHDDVCG